MSQNEYKTENISSRVPITATRVTNVICQNMSYNFKQKTNCHHKENETCIHAPNTITHRTLFYDNEPLLQTYKSHSSRGT